MKENSIEEDIKIVENYLANSAINETDSNFFKNGGWETVDLEIPKSMQHILSDYKSVLKENELLRKDIEGWKKYCEEIEEEQTEMSNKNCELEFEIEKLQKENELAKKQVEYDKTHICTPQIIKLNYIPVQKVKDKIEEEKIPLTIVGGRKNKKTLEYGIKLGRRLVLQELLEGRK